MGPFDAMGSPSSSRERRWRRDPAQPNPTRDFLRSEFWADLEPVAGVGEEWPVSPDEARRRILAEAAWVFGGMIWGFEFTYTPYDKTRAIQERFDIVPIETSAADAPALIARAFRLPRRRRSRAR